MTRYWNRVDLNRSPEQEMIEFASRFPAVGPAWQELKRKYGMCVTLPPTFCIRDAQPCQVIASA